MDRTTFVLGELHGRITPRLQELQSILSAAGKTELTTNLWGTRWSKLVFNSIVAPVCALAGVGPAHLTEAPERIRVCLELGRETLLVGPPGLQHGTGVRSLDGGGRRVAGGAGREPC